MKKPNIVVPATFAVTVKFVVPAMFVIPATFAVPAKSVIPATFVIPATVCHSRDGLSFPRRFVIPAKAGNQ